MNLIEKAKKFAKKEHGKNRRKYGSREYYYTHPYAVAERLKKFKEYRNDENILAAAYLHDILEETDIKYEDLKAQFNITIANLVKELTSDVSKYVGNGDLAKGKYLANKINNMSNNARLIKLADREHNVSNLPACPDSFTERYSRETQYILNHLNFKPNNIEKELIDSIWNYIKPYLN